MSDSHRDINAELFQAVKSGNVKEVERLINEGANVNAEDDDGKTPLHFAAENGHEEVVKALLNTGANVNGEDDGGQTPFDLTTNKEISTLLQNTAKLLEAVKNGNVQEVEHLISEGANVNATNQDGKTPLHLAAAKGYKDVVEALLAKDGINVNATNQDGKTPLHLAVVKGHKEVVEALLAKDGIDVNLPDKNKDTPLHLVLKKNNIDINVLHALLGAKKIDVNAQDGDNKTPLHLVAKKDNIDIEIVKALLGTEGIDVNIKDKLGEWTPLHWAVVQGHKEVVEALLEKDGIDVNIEGKHGKKTPLHLAAQNNNKEIVGALIKAGANINVKDKDEKTPLDLATDDKIKTLLQNAEKSDPVDESSTDSKGGQEEEKQEGDAQPEEGTGVQDNGVNPVAPTQTEEQPSSFFGSLFSILMKPFSLIASFFGGFFSWLFGSDEEKTDEPIQSSDTSVEQNNGDHNDQNPFE